MNQVNHNLKAPRHKARQFLQSERVWKSGVLPYYFNQITGKIFYHQAWKHYTRVNIGVLPVKMIWSVPFEPDTLPPPHWCLKLTDKKDTPVIRLRQSDTVRTFWLKKAIIHFRRDILDILKTTKLITSFTIIQQAIVELCFSLKVWKKNILLIILVLIQI